MRLSEVLEHSHSYARDAGDNELCNEIEAQPNYYDALNGLIKLVEQHNDVMYVQGREGTLLMQPELRAAYIARGRA